MEILQLALERTWKITDDKGKEYLEALKDTLLGQVSSGQLPTLVASTHGVLMTFCTAVWCLISDKSMWPSRLRSAGFCKMAPIVRQSLATIPALCGLVVPPRPGEAPVPPPSLVQSFLLKQAQTAPSPQATSSGYGSGGSTPAGTLTSRKKSFRIQTPGATSTATGPSQHPGLFSTIPSLKPGVPQGTVPSGAGHGISSATVAGLTVAVPSVGASLGGQSFFTTNPYSSRPAGRSQAAGTPSKDDDDAVNTKLSQLAQDGSHKRQRKGNDGDGDGEGEGADETNGSDIEGMTASARKGKSRQSPTKSAKRESSTETYTEADIAVVWADRYAKDFPALQNYRNNEALPSETSCFNLASHQAYLDSVVGAHGITSRVVFDQEGGRQYLKQKGVKGLQAV